jgi:hypothetical protein
MFYGASSFDQPIGGWVVSSATNFVSNERPKRMTQTFTRLGLFPTWMQSQVNPSLMCGVS